MSSGDVLDRIAEKAAEIRRGEAELLALAAEADRDGEVVSFGALSKLLADVGRYGLREARRLAERARALHERAGLSGTPIPATLPQTARAYAEGAIGAEHVDKVRALAEELPADVLAGEAWPIAERALAEHAREVGPRGLTRPIREFQARLDPDGKEPGERELTTPKRELRLTRRKNRCELSGFVDLETALKLDGLLDALGKPRSRAANGGDPDWRTAAERLGDALAEIVQLAAVSKEVPAGGGEPFTILLTAPETVLSPDRNCDRPDNERRGEAGRRAADLDHYGDRRSKPNNDVRGLKQHSGNSESVHKRSTATAMDGTRIPAAQIQRIACDATVITKEGTRKRSAPPALRRALIARDQGCTHPDCDRAPALCQAHHIQHFADDGPTILDNMVLLCSHHHSLIHHTGWNIAMRDRRPVFTPPRYRRPPVSRQAARADEHELPAAAA